MNPADLVGCLVGFAAQTGLVGVNLKATAAMVRHLEKHAMHGAHC